MALEDEGRPPDWRNPKEPQKRKRGGGRVPKTERFKNHVKGCLEGVEFLDVGPPHFDDKAVVIVWALYDLELYVPTFFINRGSAIAATRAIARLQEALKDKLEDETEDQFLDELEELGAGIMDRLGVFKDRIMDHFGDDRVEFHEWDPPRVKVPKVWVSVSGWKTPKGNPSVKRASVSVLLAPINRAPAKTAKDAIMVLEAIAEQKGLSC